MLRNIKALGLLAVAALAMSAMSASGAQAQNGVFTAGETGIGHEGGEIFGEQIGELNKFTTAGGEVECEVAQFSGADADGTATELTINANYRDCLANGLPATVTMNGCTYTFNQPATATTPDETKHMTGTVDLVCPEKNNVIIEIYLFGSVTNHAFKVCTQTVEPFENGGHVIYTSAKNEAGDDVVIVEANVNEIPYVEDNQACSAGEQTIPHTTSGEDGAIYESTVEVEGVFDSETEEGVTDLWISEE